MKHKISLGKMFDNLNDEHFSGVLPKSSVTWNNRAVRPSGQIAYKTRYGEIVGGKITLSAKVFEANNWDIEKVKRTLVHEMTHLYVGMKYGERGHGFHFQRKMRQITGENKNHRCSDHDSPTTGAKYRGACKCKTHYRFRKSKYINCSYKCSVCNTSFNFEKIA